MSILTVDNIGPESPAFAAAFGLLAKKTDLADYLSKSDANVKFASIQDSINSIARTVLPGTFLVAELPPAGVNQGKYAFVTDLGGGADMLLSDGLYWKYLRQGAAQKITAGTISISPLVSPPNIILDGSLLNISGAVRVQQTAMIYPGYSVRVTIPNGVLGTLGTLGVGIQGGALLPLINGQWGRFEWNGTSLNKVEGGTI